MKGNKTKFRYALEFDAWKCYFVSHWNSEHTRGLVAWYEVMVFEGRDPDLDPAPTAAEKQQLDKAAALRNALDNSMYDFELSDSDGEEHGGSDGGEHNDDLQADWEHLLADPNPVFMTVRNFNATLLSLLTF